MENHVYLPNEIFNDFKKYIKPKHNQFAYAYYYYITYLYRYCKWYVDEKVTQSMIKQKLQLYENDKNVNYLIKKDGLLEQIGYVKTTTNYPIAWTMENGLVEFKMVEEHNHEHHITTIIPDRGFKVKTPVKSFFRKQSSEKEKILDGTFYEVENTHKIDYKIFEKCMNDKDLGVNAFYIYGYIKHKNVISNKYKLPSRNVKGELMMSDATFRKYARSLEENKMIIIDAQKFVGEKGFANGYTVL